MLLYSYNKDIFHDYTIYKSIINFSIILFKTEKEAYYIDLYKAYDEGYNSTRGNIFKHGKEKRSEAYDL